MSSLITLAIEAQRTFFFSGKTLDIEFRKSQLRKLKKLIQDNEALFYQAIEQDFKKSAFETFMTELSFIYMEIDHALKKIHQWSKVKRVSTGLMNFPASSYLHPEPFGCTLIIGAWNYPYQLTLVPVVSAIAAGNVCLIKPSELPSRTAAVMEKLINDNFDPGFLRVVTGGVEISSELLEHKFDKIFFTGSTQVGKIVAKKAAEFLTPVTLELGGKSPCFVFADCDVKRAAQRIAWGKILNAGQTCIAPDYLLVEEKIAPSLLAELKLQMEKLVSETRIINLKHTQRLKNLIDPKKVFSGGEVSESENYIEPTILHNVSWNDEVMQDEIFGPILPVITFKDLTEVLPEVKKRPKPLALYIFGEDRGQQNKILNTISFGGGGINETIMHISNANLPFGGVGESGMGNYHGEAGFKTFSHTKGYLKKPTWFEATVKYPPYTSWKMKLLRLLLK